MSATEPSQKPSILAEFLTRPRRLKVTRRMWLSLKVLLVLLAASGLNSILMLQRINVDVVKLAETELPLEEAVLEMEINAGEATRGVLDYVRNVEQAHLNLAHDAEADFERYAVQCARLVETEEERKWVEQAMSIYGEYKGLSDQIIELVDERHEALVRFRNDVKRIDDLIESRVQLSLDRTGPEAMKKLESALDMEVSIGKAFAAIESYILHADADIEQEVLRAEQEFERYEAMYRETQLTEDEREWLNQIDEFFADAVVLGNRIMRDTDALRLSLAQFEGNLEAMDEILDNKIQPLIQLATHQAEEDVRRSSKNAITVTLITSTLALAMLGGMLLFTSRYFMQRMGGLVDGANQFGSGNLSHRIPHETQDEMGELAAAFNDMADKRERAERALSEAYGQIEKHNVELEALVAKRTAEVIAVQDLAVFSLAQLADSRDPETGEHLMRLRTYAQILAEQLRREGPYVDEIDDEFLYDLYRASPLHDIGKVGIADAILLKPGKLSDDQFQLMKQHVNIGADALEKGMKQCTAGHFLQMAADVARYHHERFDGTGYCEGLAGQDIPLAARIVALADVYDALTSKRVYKPALSAQEAKEIIEEESGKHFDPAVVEAFQACFHEFVAVRGELPSEEAEFQKQLALTVGA